MIQSKQDYHDYLAADKRALGISTETLRQKILVFFFPYPTYKFQRQLRKCEYYKNCKKGIINKLFYFFCKYRLGKLSVKFGFSIPENVFGPGLAIMHHGTIVVNANAKVGANCRIHPSTSIGASGGTSKAPSIGNNVYISPGAKIYGDIIIGNNIAIAPNAAVGKSFEEENILIGGVPAKKIKEIDITQILKHVK